MFRVITAPRPKRLRKLTILTYMPIPRIKIVFAVSVINMFLQTIKSTVFVAHPLHLHINYLFHLYKCLQTLSQILWAARENCTESTRQIIYITLGAASHTKKKAFIKMKGSHGSVKQCFSLFKTENQSR